MKTIAVICTEREWVDLLHSKQLSSKHVERYTRSELMTKKKRYLRIAKSYGMRGYSFDKVIIMPNAPSLQDYKAILDNIYLNLGR